MGVGTGKGRGRKRTGRGRGGRLSAGGRLVPSRRIGNPKKGGKAIGTKGRGTGFPPKRVGEIGELEFMQASIRRRFGVSKPWGDSDRYDAITDWRSFLSRVQVRTTESLVNGCSYAVHASVHVGKKNVGLTKKDCDVLAAYIFPRDIWYIIPVEKFTPRKNLAFFPDGTKKGAMFEEYREAWWWLKGRRKKRRKKSGRGEKKQVPRRFAPRNDNGMSRN